MTLPTKAMSKRWAAYVREHGSVIFLSDHPVLDLVDAYVDGVLVPVEPDYEAMAKRMPELIDIAAFWTENNCIGLAHQLWAAGVGEETP